MKFKKKKQYNININAGDIETSTEIFNNSVNTDACGLGEDINSYDKISDKEKIFKEIIKFNPRANYHNYDNKSVRQMLAILNNYKDKKERLVDKPHIVQYGKKPNNEYDFSDIYLDEHSGDYMIKGLQIGFDTEEEAKDYIIELKREEE